MQKFRYHGLRQSALRQSALHAAKGNHFSYRLVHLPLTYQLDYQIDEEPVEDPYAFRVLLLHLPDGRPVEVVQTDDEGLIHQVIDLMNGYDPAARTPLAVFQTSPMYGGFRALFPPKGDAEDLEEFVTRVEVEFFSGETPGNMSMEQVIIYWTQAWRTVFPNWRGRNQGNTERNSSNLWATMKEATFGVIFLDEARKVSLSK